MPDEKDLFRSGMRRVSGTVSVVTTLGANGERRGVTATAFCSLSVDPPSLIACINRETWVGQLAPVSGNFCINVLSDSQRDVAETFAGRSALAAGERFNVGDWTKAASGAPVLEDSIVSFDCTLDTAIDHATHVILIGRVLQTLEGAEDELPLLYADGQFTTTALAATMPGAGTIPVRA